MPLIMQRHRKVSNMALSKGFEYSRHGWKVLAALWVILLLVVAVPSVGASVVNAAIIFRPEDESRNLWPWILASSC